ncbi:MULTISPECIES: magnesium transporter [unclassified Pseudovibrio]|uniref:magnesium transporter n=1 Tax=unclassified Pseudovibrio TaxID=2627060 RepID=UPI0007AE6F95|nr:MULTISPECIES: magnesium transporter [unclassified Pseudovibrio]KZL05896.1 Magnesium transporter MgtE [Pseudovibrio sp. Ad26]KZL23914.1 Magnesium transporter MgtE [Pseudovibrio sp. WM33]
MTQSENPGALHAAPPPPHVRDASGHLDTDFVARVEAALDTRDAAVVRELAGNLHDADMGDLLEMLREDDRVHLIQLLGEEFDFAALTETEEPVRAQVLEALPEGDVVEGIGELESDDAVYLLEDMEQEEQEKILAQLPNVDQVQIKRALEFPEDTAGRIVQTDFIAVPPFWTVGQVIDHLRSSQDLPDSFYELYVVDPGFHLLGAVALDRLLRTKRSKKISKIMEETRHSVLVTDDQEDVARLFERYNLVSVAVTDTSERLVGIVTVDDIVDVIQEEAEEDMLAMAGVGDEEISDSVLEIAKSRFSWLSVNVFTAIFAAFVISLFTATIERMVALAVLMPIVASMGGNSGTQTMAVTVRAIATQELNRRNILRVLRRELLVGLINGVGLGFLIGAIAGGWFLNPELGVVIGSAILINSICAGLFGLLVPMGLEKIGADPAIASSVFVTTITDVVGFFTFLVLAAWWFGLPY